MKCKALLTGSNSSAIDDFFVHMEEMEVMSTSPRYEDVAQHIKYFKPDLFVYCITNETGSDFKKMLPVKYLLNGKRIPCILIGTKENFDDYVRSPVNIADLFLQKPLSANMIQERILAFLEDGQESGFENITKPNVSDQSNGSTQPGASVLSQSSAKPKAVMQPEQSASEAALALLEQLKKESEPQKQKDTAKNGEDAGQEIRRKHILAIDDNSMVLRVIKENLRDDYDVATAISGKVAFQFLQKKKTDLIILDYEMPEEDGPAVLEKLRANEDTKDIPVIFLTGTSEREKIQKALIMKPQGYLLKPIDRDKLQAAIEKLLGNHGVD